VNSSQPTGVDDQQKINMAVAIHMKKTAKMDYAYKDFEPKQWRHHTAWLNVKDTPKFKYNYPTTVALTPAARTGVVSSSEAGPTNAAAIVTDTIDDSPHLNPVSLNNVMLCNTASRGAGLGVKKAESCATQEEERTRDKEGGGGQEKGGREEEAHRESDRH
jgi:hypothetical protein